MSECRVTEKPLQLEAVCDGRRATIEDVVAVEEPMEIRLVLGPSETRTMRSVSITMRTPGHDDELAAGFLFTEGLLADSGQIEAIHFRGVDPDGHATGNVVRVDLKPEVRLDLARLQRHFYTTSSCGVCGKASLEALDVQGVHPVAEGPQVDAGVICELPEALRARQPTFSRTGGLHAAAHAALDGKVHLVREDVGRHNAVDKLVGHRFLSGGDWEEDPLLVVSGRASFEIVQKALVARFRILVAVGAPSTLAIETARKFGMTLVGFSSKTRFNIYCGGERVG